MIFLLRVVRAIFGFIFALQVVQLVEALIWMFKPEVAGVDIGKGMALLLIKIVILAIASAVFFLLRSLINKVHTTKHGSPHPVLGNKRWAL